MRAAFVINTLIIVVRMSKVPITIDIFFCQFTCIFNGLLGELNFVKYKEKWIYSTIIKSGQEKHPRYKFHLSKSTSKVFGRYYLIIMYSILDNLITIMFRLFRTFFFRMNSFHEHETLDNIIK